MVKATRGEVGQPPPQPGGQPDSRLLVRWLGWVNGGLAPSPDGGLPDSHLLVWWPGSNGAQPLGSTF